jgi:hypothetical protein
MNPDTGELPRIKHKTIYRLIKLALCKFWGRRKNGNFFFTEALKSSPYFENNISEIFFRKHPKCTGVTYRRGTWGGVVVKALLY